MKSILPVLIIVFFIQSSIGQTSQEGIIKVTYAKDFDIVQRSCDASKNSLRSVAIKVSCRKALAEKGFTLKIKATGAGGEEATDINLLTRLLEFDNSNIDKSASDEFTARFNDTIYAEILCDKSLPQIDKSVTFDITCGKINVQVPKKYSLIIYKAIPEKKKVAKSSTEAVYTGKDTIIRKKYGHGHLSDTIIRLPFTFTCSKKLGQEGFSLNVTAQSVSAKENRDYHLFTKRISLQKDSSSGLFTSISDTIILELPGDTLTDQPDKYILVRFDTTFVSVKMQRPVNLAILKPKEPSTYNPDIPFRFSVGANFDFGARKTLINDLYTELSVFKPDIIKIPKKGKRTFRIGLFGAIYQNTFTSYDSSLLYNLKFLVKQQHISDTTNMAITETYDRKANIALSTLGVVISPVVRLFNTADRNFTFTLYGCLHMEAIQRRYTLSYSYSKLSTDTTILSKTNHLSVHPSSAKIDKDAFMYYDKLIGIGFPFRLSTKAVELNIKPIFFGVSLGEINNPYSNKCFYLWQFSIIENKYGINLGGELRGFYGNNGQTMLSIHLCKVFDLTKLASYMSK